MKFFLSICIFNLVAAVAGIATGLFVYQDTAPESNHTQQAYDELYQEVRTLSALPRLPATYKNWDEVKRYVEVYQNVLLSPASQEGAEETAGHSVVAQISVDKWGGLLSGKPQDVFTVAKRIQHIAPVYFDRLSVAASTDEPIAKISLYVLGSNDNQGPISRREDN